MNWFEHVITKLNSALFTAGSDHVSWSVLFAVATALATTAFAMRLRVSNFVLGIVNAGFLLTLSLVSHSRIDTALQGTFLALGFLGWWLWLRGGPQRGALPLGSAGNRLIAGCIGFVVVGTAGLTALFTSLGDARPLWNGLITALGLAAQFLLNLKKVQNWFFWLASDILYLPMLVMDGFWLTATVYVVTIVLCVAGLRFWLARLKLQQPVAPVLAVADR
jgi:nicotinamide mononucleotide transporter